MMTLLLAGMFISCNQKIPGPPPVGFESSYPNVCQTEDGFIMIWTDGDNEIAMSEFTPDGWSPKKSIISSE